MTCRSLERVYFQVLSTLLSFGLLLLASCDPGFDRGASPSPPRGEAPSRREVTRPRGLTETRVIRVVDGDTIVISGGIKVRYIGIDTPETKHPTKPVQRYGPEASAANKRLVQGQVVGLEFDVDRTDQYGRTLAYIWLGNTLVNAWLVKNGFARVSTYPPNVKYASLFRRLQKEAREGRRGLWGGAQPF